MASALSYDCVSMDEFGFISALLAPLAKGQKGALGLKDDAAVLGVPRGYELVVTKDALCEGVHFIGDEPAGLIARKLLRVNLSDLAAMGAKPWGYFLALMLPASVGPAWLGDFAAGLGRDQKEFVIALMGGDTTCTKGPLSLSVTALGLVPSGKALRRSGAKKGDGIYVSGTIGDAALGLQVASFKLQAETCNFFLQRYRLPQPRLKLGQRLRGIASACMDISDGLAQDLEHICTASGVGAEIDWPAVPLSSQARAALESIGNPYEIVLAGGDDYELLFTVPPGAERKLQAVAKSSEVPLTCIGRVVSGSGVRVLDAAQKEIMLARKGYRHF
jgi:thiamine-monophosphate kinase